MHEIISNLEITKLTYLSERIIDYHMDNLKIQNYFMQIRLNRVKKFSKMYSQKITDLESFHCNFVIIWGSHCNQKRNHAMSIQEFWSQVHVKMANVEDKTLISNEFLKPTQAQHHQN